MTTTPAPPITVVGESVADAFVTSDGDDSATLTVHAGGGPANTAVALARLGTPARFLGRLSAGPLGSLMRRRLTASGVDLSGAVTTTAPATLAIAQLDSTGSAAYDFYAEGTADWRWTRQELAAALGGGTTPACVHSGSLALALPPGGPLIEEALTRARETSTICIDPNVRPSLVDLDEVRERLPDWCRLADILRLSSEDAELLMPGAGPDEAARRLMDHGAGLVVITCGAQGALGYSATGRLHVPVPEVKVVDTVGAGDSFTAGLLHRLATDGLLGGRLDGLRDEQLWSALEFAASVAARTCEVAGPNPPYAADLRSGRGGVERSG
ncbi:carbohydrate kinase [Streptomyces sp. NPDC002793]|uniref:carbohydrate kinase family protein n=1 Tax=Streptomyces sp. NPDC002793 TaxID=3154432 RepID=UPI00332A1BB4